MNLNKRIVVLILLIILFVFLIVHQKSIESFIVCDSVNCHESAFKAGFFSVVSSDDDNEDSYDLDWTGLKCLANMCNGTWGKSNLRIQLGKMIYLNGINKKIILVKVIVLMQMIENFQ